MSLLEVRSVTKAFGSLVAVDNVSLSVGTGELHAIIGPN
ncbi:MAG: ABC transporter ATP-binding protein, partial [Pseudomonadota bacterium]|nr:ABC transporter ATP-binding protein [Pseudomonadota bacterium]